jgi:hypothetical protein
MHCKEGRLLEISAAVSVAPGFLSSYTKIVRFLPRYVIFNRLQRPVRLWQDSSIFRPVGEDRTALTEESDSLKEIRKWRYAHEEKQSHTRDKINQYESLYGRPAVVDERPVSIAEGTTAHHSALYITTIGPSELLPFYLPDSRGERQLRVDTGGTHNMTSSFASDFPGEHTLKVTKAVDLRLLNHVSTRAAPKYKIVLPPPSVGGSDWDGELGVYFETDWGGDNCIIVKGTRRGKYAFNHTDIHVGDELLRIDGKSVHNMTFSETMKLLKERVSYVSMMRNQQGANEPQRKGLRKLSIGIVRNRKASMDNSQSSVDAKATLTLTFRTLEERLRKLRMKAGHEIQPSSREGLSRGIDKVVSQRSLQVSDNDRRKGNHPSSEADGNIHVEMKSLHNTMFVVLKNEDTENPPFRIQNRSLNHVVFFRQRGCDGHPWNHLKPGDSMTYAWEEPMKNKKLTVRVAANTFDIHRLENQLESDDDSGSDANSQKSNQETDNAVSNEQEKRKDRAARLRQAFSYQFVDTEERGGFGPSVTVRLEEIGYKNILPLPSRAPKQKQGSKKKREFLSCEVDTDGGTRLLVISDNGGADDDRGVLSKHLDVLRKQIAIEQDRSNALGGLKYLLNQRFDEDLPTSPEVSSLGENSKEELVRTSAVETDAKRMMEDFPEESTITRRHQIVVEVIEAAGLNPGDYVGNCNPYCEVIMKGRSKSRKHILQKRKNKRKTYFVEKSLDPKWTDQIFVFDVPEEAINVTRGHSLQVNIRNFKLVGQHPIMGLAAVHLGSVRDQKELLGWYPLAPKSGRRDAVESVSQSEWGRGSVKLRVQWIYSVPALLDYFLMLSDRRLMQLTKSRQGMQEQLSHAIDTDERKREAKDEFAGRIQKLNKIQKRKGRKKKIRKKIIAQGAKAAQKSEKLAGNVAGKIGGGLHTGMNVAGKIGGTTLNVAGKIGGSTLNAAGKIGGTTLNVVKDTLKTSRDKYLHTLHSQTVESKRRRQSEINEKSAQQLGADLNDDPDDARDPLQNSYGSNASDKNSSFANESPRKARDFSGNVDTGSSESAPDANEMKRSNSLDDYFSKQGVHESFVTPSRGPKPSLSKTRATPVRNPVKRQARRATGVKPDVARRSLMSHRKLSLDIDGPLDEESPTEYWQDSGGQDQAEEDRRQKHIDARIADMLSVGTDQQEENNRKKAIALLMKNGFIFHESGVFFHEDHLPHRFRKSLFASSKGGRQAGPSYRPKFAVGSTSAIRHFKSSQSANHLFQDLKVDVVTTDSNFIIRLREADTSSPPPVRYDSISEAAVAERLIPPNRAPITMRNRANDQLNRTVISRNMFERACKRTLSSILNPGGWLTIRPITALNLPDTYQGMFVKLRYGSEALTSDTVDAKVTPRWAPAGFLETMQEKSSGVSPKPLTRDEFKFTENDLHVHVEPQQTSGSIKISVVAERLNNKTELGVLHIPLGAAIAACIDAAEENPSSKVPTLYARWFPLMNPRMAVPVEGDMALSARPRESEKIRDSMFTQYFAPCIQLALIWWPENAPKGKTAEKETAVVEKDEDSDMESEYVAKDYEMSGAITMSSDTEEEEAETSGLPKIENYFNADIGRISVALIDSQRALELLSFSALEIDIRHSMTKTKTRMGLVIGWIQLDHQDVSAREPVVLAPTPVEKLRPTLQVLAVKDNLRSKSNIISYEYVGVSLQEMDLTVEESWIFELWDFFMAISKKRKVKKRNATGQRRADVLMSSDNCFTATEEEEEKIESASLMSILEAEGENASTRTKFYIEQLILGLVKVNLSYIKGKKKNWELTDQGARALKNLEVKELPQLAIQRAQMQLDDPTVSADQSEVFLRWSQHTFEEDLVSHGGCKCTMPLGGRYCDFIARTCSYTRLSSRCSF